MSYIGEKQFSTKIKVPQGVLFNRPDRLAEVFQDILEGYLGKGRFRVTARPYMYSLMCRFTVIFKEKPWHPESIRELIKKVASRTVVTVITEPKKEG